MSDPVWRVYNFDRASVPGMTRRQDMTRFTDMTQTTFLSTTGPHSPPNTVRWSFLADTPDLNIRSLSRTIAGWFDPDTGICVRPDFGGRLLRPRRSVQGNLVRFTCPLVDYNLELRTTMIYGWPHVLPNLPSGITDGWPVGTSVRDALIGTTGEGLPYNGLIPAHLGFGTRWLVHPIFNEIFFDYTTIFGLDQTGVFGQLNPMRLDRAINLVLRAAVNAWLVGGSRPITLRPSFWMEPYADSTGDIVARFRCSNMVPSLLDVVATFATDANTGAGEYLIEQPYAHERDATDLVNRPFILGMGRDPSVSGSPLVYAESYNADHASHHPTDYQLIPGWAADLGLETRLHTVATAQQITDWVEYQTWDGTGAIEFSTRRYTTPGEILRVRIPQESLDGPFPVREVTVEPNVGSPIYHLRLGWETPTAEDVIAGAASDTLLLRESRAFAAYSDGGAFVPWSLPGQPPQIPAELLPTHLQRNDTRPRTREVPGGRIFASARINPTDPTAAVADAWQVFGVNADNTTPADPNLHVKPDPTGGPGPQEYHLPTVGNGTAGTVVMRIARIKHLTVKGTGNAALQKNGSTVAGPYAGTGGGALYTFAVVNFARFDSLDVVTTGVTDTLRVVVSE